MGLIYLFYSRSAAEGNAHSVLAPVLTGVDHVAQPRFDRRKTLRASVARVSIDDARRCEQSWQKDGRDSVCTRVRAVAPRSVIIATGPWELNYEVNS